MKTIMNNGILEITPETLLESASELRIIDVRRPDEFNAELGHIEGAELLTLGTEDLEEFMQQSDKNRPVVFVCRSGGRSGHATAQSKEHGFTQSYNMQGGMLRWNELGLPVARN